MSKEFKNIDELFQSAFENDAAEVPAFIKTNIDKRIAGNSKKIGWWKWGGLFLLLTATCFSFLYLNGNLSEDISSNKNDNNILLSEQSNNQTETPDDLNRNENMAVNENDLTGSENQQTDAVSVSQNTIESNELITDKKVQHEQVNPTLSGTGKVHENTKSDDLNSESAQKDTGSEKVALSSDNDVATSMEKSENRNGTNALTISGLNPRQFSKDYTRSSVLKNEPKSLLNNPVRYPFSSSTESVFANTIQHREVYNPWMITANGVMSLSQSKYSVVNSTELTTYEDSNKDKPSFGFDLLATCRLQNSLTFGTGLSLTQLAENYHYFKEDVFIDSTLTWTYQDIYQYDSLLDTTIWVGVDSSYTADYDTTKKVMYDYSGETKATYFSVPLSIGTQIITEKFRFDFYVAGRFNYLLNASGGYVMNDAFHAFTNSNQIFRKMYFDVVLGTNVHYKLTDHFYLTGSLKYKPAFQEIYQGLSFNKSMHSVQIGAGVSWKF